MNKLSAFGVFLIVLGQSMIWYSIGHNVGNNSKEICDSFYSKQLKESKGSFTKWNGKKCVFYKRSEF